jgi:hypothetical protein
MKPDITQNFVSPHYQRHNQRRQEHLASLNLPLARKTVLEIGAGIGDHTSFFLDRECTVTSSDGRIELLSILKQRFPESTTIAWDIETPPPGELWKSQIVYAYGILYHTSKPEIALENLASVCTEILLLETCVSYGDERLINLTSELIDDPTQALRGIGCRPTRPWVFEKLKSLFPFVYVTKTQPWHQEFPIDWTKPPLDECKGLLTRSIFVASRHEILNDKLSSSLIDQQEHG